MGNISGRNYGVDFLRIISMCMVVILHILGQGGGIADHGINHYTTWFYESFAYCAVDCFALISGFVGYSSVRKKFRADKLFRFWLSVFFYSFGITLILFMLRPNAVDLETLVNSALPISTNAYWYATAYIPIIALAPYLNIFIGQLSKNEIKTLLAIIFAFFSVYYILPIYDPLDPFKLNNGYSFLWLLILYVAGAGLKRLDLTDMVSNKAAVAFLLASSAIICLGKLYVPQIRVMNYTSPFVILNAAALLCIFSKVRMKGLLLKFTKTFSPAAFGVYLIHAHPLIYKRYLKDLFSWIGDLNWVVVLVIVPGYALFILLICLCIEKLRLLVFSMFRWPGRHGDSPQLNYQLNYQSDQGLDLRPNYQSNQVSDFQTNHQSD